MTRPAPLLDVGGFEQFWNESFDRLDAYVRDLKQTREAE